MSVLNGETIRLLEKALDSKQSSTSKKETATRAAIVTRVDDEGTVWVSISGAEEDTPVKYKEVEVSRGDVVDVAIQNGYAKITGNITNPSTDDRVANAALSRVTVVETENQVISGKLEAAEASIDKLSAEDAEIRTLVAGKADVQELTAAKADIAALKAKDVEIEGNVSAASARIGDIEADYLKAEDMQAETARVDSLLANKATVNDLNAATGRIYDLETDHVSTTDLAATNARIGNIEVDYLKAEDMEAEEARVDSLLANKATVNDLNAATGRITTLESDNVAVKGRLDAAEADIDSLEADHVSITDLQATNARIGTVEADYLKAEDMEAEEARVDNLLANKANVSDLTAATGRIGTLETDNVSVKKRLTAAEGDIDTLETDNVTVKGKLTAAEGEITNLKSSKADISVLESNYITADAIDATYMHANMSNSDVAWISNGVIANGAISSAMINDVSANKLTAGTINGSVINVTNLNADNITTGTINGQRIGEGSLSLDKLSEDVYTEAEVDAKLSTMQAEIDGAIETWTGTDVPTLNNTPASNWADSATRDTHVGDVYFVVNSESQQNGYNYRFTKTGSTYSWQLIKDNDVTNALKRISAAEGKITTFDSDISTLKTDTGTLTTKTESLETRMTDAESDILDKVDTTTFSEVSDTVDEHTRSISQMTETLSNKADGSTVTSLTNRVNKTESDISGINTTIGELQTTVESKADGTTVTTISDKLNTVEDTVDGHTQTISSVQSTLSTKADNSTVSTLRSEYNETKTTVAGTVTKLGAVETTVNGVRSDLDNLSIGGRNLLYLTRDFAFKSGKNSGGYLTYADGLTDETYLGLTVRHFDASTLTSNYHDFISYNNLLVPTVGTTYILSFYAKGHGSIITHFYPNTSGGTLYHVSSQGQTSWATDGYTTVTLSEEWERVWVKYTVGGTQGTDKRNILIRINKGDNELYVCGMKFEVAEVPSDWSPAPEDMEVEVSEFKSEYATFKQTVTEFESTVGETYATKGDISGMAGENLLRVTPKSHNPADYLAYLLNLEENLVVGEKYTLQFWDVDVAHSGKDSSDLNLGVYWGGGNNPLCGMSIPSGHADYITRTFTASYYVEAQTQNSWLEVYNTPPNVSGTRNLSIGKWKIERGENATKWTLNPEDSATSSELTALEERTTNAETSIEQNKDAISLKANANDVYTKTATDGLISTEVTNRNAAIEAKASEINLSVSETYTTKTEFANLDVGGTNLLRDTKAFWRNGVESTETGYLKESGTNAGVTYLGFTVRTTDPSGPGKFGEWLVNDTKPGEEYTLSFYAKGTAQPRCYFYGPSGYTLVAKITTARGTSTAGDGNSDNAGGFDISETEWRRFWVTWKLSDTAGTTDEKYALIRNDNLGEIYVCGAKLERGNKATDWTPAPKDQEVYTDSQIESAKAEIKVTTDGISSEVSKVSSAKYVNATSTGWTLANLKTYAAEGRSELWNVTSTEGFRVGDTVYVKGTDSTRECTVYVKTTVTSVNSATNFTGTSHGYEDVLPVDTIKSTINQSSDSVKIKANHVEIDGTAVFSAIKSQADAAYDAKDAASTALSDAKSYADTKKTEAISAAASDATSKLRSYSTTDAMNQAIGDAVDAIEVGGRNLLPRSATGGAGWSYTSVTDGVFMRSTTSTTESFISTGTTEPLELSTTYTFSCWAKTNGKVKSVDMFIYDGAIKTIRARSAIQVGEDWEFLEWTFNTPDAWASGTDPTWWTARFDNNGSVEEGVEAILYVKRPKLEKGNKATDWTPAPEDTDAAISTAKSEAITSANSSTDTKLASYSTTKQMNEVIQDATGPLFYGEENSSGYIHLGHVPYEVSSYSNYSHLHLTGRIGGWLSTTSGSIDITFKSRDNNVTYNTVDRKDDAIDTSFVDVLVYTGSDNYTHYWLKVSSYWYAQLYAEFEQFVEDDHTRTTAEPDGTCVWKLSEQMAQMNIAIGNAVDAIEVGGRNLLRNTNWSTEMIAAFPRGNTGVDNNWMVENPVTITYDSDNGLFKLETSSSGGRYGIYQDVPDLIEGETYIFSVDVGDACAIDICKYKTWNNWTKTVLSDTGRYVVSFAAPSESVRIYMHSNNLPNRTAWYRYPKLEKGNKATDWTPAPEDTDAAIAAVKTTADAAAPKANAVKRTQRIYWRSASSMSSWTMPTAWVTVGNDGSHLFAQWTTKVPRLTANADGTGTKYLYLYTCEQREMADGTLAYTTVLLDDSTTVIDGGTIITGSVSANAVNASSGTFDVANIPNLSAAKITSGTIDSARINASSLVVGSSTLGTVLDGKADDSDIPTKVSQLSNDSSFATTGQVSTAKSEAISAAATDATTKANAAAQTATNYINASGSGIKIASSTSADTYQLMTATSTDFYVDADGTSTDVLSIGVDSDKNPLVRIGDSTSGNYTVVDEDSFDVYNTSYGSSPIAHIGYGEGNSESSTSYKPYYTFGTRRTTTTAYSSSETYAVGDHVLYNGIEYVCKTAITTAEAWTSSHWQRDIGNWSVAEGYNTTASGSYGHAEGWGSTASGYNSHAQNHNTIAAYSYQTAIGKYNDNKSGNLFEIGNGTSSARSNAFEVSKYGDVTAAGTITGGIASNFTTSWHVIVNASSVTAGGYLDGTVALSKSGYTPIGVVGQTSNQRYVTLIRAYISNAADGSGTLNWMVYNPTSSAKTPTMQLVVLWAKS